MDQTGVTVGSSDTGFCDIFSNPENMYILGLWCADGYHRTSSIGLSNTDEKLIAVFRDFLLQLFPSDRLRLRIYVPMRNQTLNVGDIKDRLHINHLSVCYLKKAKSPTIHMYVNCRALLRQFKKSKLSSDNIIDNDCIWAYFAGRFDGDGSISSDGRSDCRIVYGYQDEAEKDLILLNRVGFKNSKIYNYKQAHTYCLYISRYEAEVFMRQIRVYARTQKPVSVTL